MPSVSEFLHYEQFCGLSLPSVRTLVDGPLITFEHFDADEGALEPCIRTSIEADVTTFEYFDDEESRTDPALRATIDGDLSVVEHFDPEESTIDPCWKVENLERDGEQPSAVTFSVGDPGLDLTVLIGDRTWKLRDGGLVEV